MPSLSVLETTPRPMPSTPEPGPATLPTTTPHGGITGPTTTPGPVDLAGLLVAAGRKDEAAFRALYTACSRRVFGLAHRIVRDPETSADITQDVFLLVWAQGDRYTPALGHPINWLLTLTHHKAVDRIRADVTRKARNQKWGTQHHVSAFDQVSETVIDRDDADRVHTSLASLSPLQREAITLAYYSHLTYTEVAAHLDIPLSTVKTRIRDGLTKLRTTLETHNTHT